MIEAGGSIEADEGFASMAEGRRRTITLGSGQASVTLRADGNVRIKRWGYHSDDTEYPFAFDDFTAHLDDVFAQIDVQFSNIEPSLHGLPDHIRGRVSRKLEKARRRMEDAQRRVEETVQSAVRDIGDRHIHAAAAEFELPESLRGVEPVTEQERLAVLQMLEEGKITVQEAERLLAALEGRR
jgi:ElaB/YqjD/DUF883 family membrane-anchored ribosome-binding protein